MSSIKIDECENKYWYNDKREWHREDGPAVEGIDGDKYWYINDKLHREDGLAIEWWNGNKWYYYNDELIGKSDEGFTKEDFKRYLKIKEYW